MTKVKNIQEALLKAYHYNKVFQNLVNLMLGDPYNRPELIDSLRLQLAALRKEIAILQRQETCIIDMIYDLGTEEVRRGS